MSKRSQFTLEHAPQRLSLEDQRDSAGRGDFVVSAHDGQLNPVEAGKKDAGIKFSQITPHHCCLITIVDGIHGSIFRTCFDLVIGKVGNLGGTLQLDDALNCLSRFVV